MSSLKNMVFSKSNKQFVYKKCNKILQILKDSSNADPFQQPVDPLALGIPDYFKIIKNPMDLSSVEAKLIANKYTSPYDFFKDLEQIWQNAFIFNTPGTLVYQMCENISNDYQVLKKKEFENVINEE